MRSVPRLAQRDVHRVWRARAALTGALAERANVAGRPERVEVSMC